MNRPDLTFQITVAGEIQEIKWTYGLANDIQRLTPDAEAVLNGVISDPYIRDYITRRLLTNTKGSISEESDLVSYEALEDVDPDELLAMLDWAIGHILYFFASSAGNLHRRVTAFRTALPESNPSTAGSEDSASTTPSAGPSE